MSKIIVEIIRVEQDGKYYYIGTSKQINGLLIEGNSYTEVQEMAPKVIKMFMEEKSKRELEEQINSIDSILSYEEKKEECCLA